MDAAGLLVTLHAAADAAAEALGGLEDWGLAGTRSGQYRSDLAADAAAIAVLRDAGFGILSEESGVHGADADLLAVIDPVDGSTNASRRLPWYATSICVLDGTGPLVALVVNQATGDRFEAFRGGGARRNGQVIAPSGCTDLSDALVGISGLPDEHMGWRQFRALGAAALDLCAVATGQLDGYVDCLTDAHGVWDYAGAVLICREAGAVVAEAQDRELYVRDPAQRRTPVAAATPALLAQLVARRRQVGDGSRKRLDRSVRP